MTTAEDRPATPREVWRFVLYCAGPSTASERAETVLRSLCAHFLAGRYEITVVDITDPAASVPEDVLAAPTVVRTAPLPQRRVIGDLSHVQKAKDGLGFSVLEL